jgi:dolichol-phosphate mannosyltransferase
MTSIPGSRRSVSIVVPACNEEDAVALLPERLYPTLADLLQNYDLELVLVDDGSRDQTWQRLNDLAQGSPPCPIILRRHQRNQGLGAALRTGAEHASGEIIVTVDADGTYPFAIIEPLVAAIEGGAQVATASPYHEDGRVDGVTPMRLMFSRGASLCYRVLVDRQIATYTAMVRAYQASVLRQSISDSDGFLHVAMTLVEARRRGAEVVEVPAVLSRRQVGVSKAKVWRITRSHLRYMGQIAWLRASGRFWLDATVVEPASGLEATRHG